LAGRDGRAERWNEFNKHSVRLHMSLKANILSREEGKKRESE
jgi:hypothetical protein